MYIGIYKMGLLYIGFKVKIYLEPRSRASKVKVACIFFSVNWLSFAVLQLCLFFSKFLLLFFFLSFRCSNNSTRSFVFLLWNSQCMKTQQVLEIAPCLSWDLYFHHFIIILLPCVYVCSSNKHFWSFVTFNLCRWKFSVCVQRPNCFFLATYMSALLFSYSVMSDTLQPHGLQHARLPCPSLSLEFAQTHAHWVNNAIQPSYPLSSPSLAIILSQHQSFPMSQLFSSGGQSIGALALVLPMNIQGWFPLGLTGLIFLQSKGLSRVFSSTMVWKHQFFSAQSSLWSNPHICTGLLKKP